jgi:DNA-binding transcriptional LysR family regulator
MIHDLESIFGVPLFERLPRGMQPTELGAEVVAFANRMIVELDRFAQDLDKKHQGGYGQLIVGAIMGAAPDVVAHAVAEIKRSRPRLVVKLLGETSDEILSLLAQRRLDLAVGRYSNILQHNDLDYEVLGNEILCIVARKNHPLSKARNLELRSLSRAGWILQPLTSPARQIMEQEFGEAGMMTPTDIVECRSIFATLQLVQTSDAITVLPDSVVRDHLRAQLLVRLPLPVGKNLPGFGILTRRGEAVSAAVTEFIQILRRHGAEMEGRALAEERRLRSRQARKK